MNTRNTIVLVGIMAILGGIIFYGYNWKNNTPVDGVKLVPIDSSEDDLFANMILVATTTVSQDPNSIVID